MENQPVKDLCKGYKMDKNMLNAIESQVDSQIGIVEVIIKKLDKAYGPNFKMFHPNVVTEILNGINLEKHAISIGVDVQTAGSEND